MSQLLLLVLLLCCCCCCCYCCCFGRTVGEPFETFSLALAFPADFNDSAVFDFSASIVRLQVGIRNFTYIGFNSR
jgi:hypothetical protein